MEFNLDRLEITRKKDELSKPELEYLDTLSESEVKSIIEYCSNKYNYYNAMQTALKLILNSVYGAFGNPFFVCSTTDIAGAITAMGRDVIKYMDTINEKYWYEFWHDDLDLHDELKLTKVPSKIDDAWIHRESKTQHDEEVTQQQMEDGEYQRKIPVSAYVDTDSLFVTFEPVIDDLEIGDSEAQAFVEKISKYRLEPLFRKKLEGYAKRFNVKNIQDFELENISESIIFLTKKKYIKHVIWEDGTQYERLSNIVPKGVDLIKKGTPKFAREKLMKILHYIFDHSKTYNIKHFLKYVRELKKEFELADINDIVQGASINSYYSQMIEVDGARINGPGIIKDADDFVFGKGTYYTIKAAGFYNFLLHSNPELVNHYEEIKPGIKVKIYPCKHNLNDKFCYIPGKYPKEFAPEVDYDELFQKTVADQVNTYIKALGLPELNKRLKVVVSLF
jgi:hypothetical protein